MAKRTGKKSVDRSSPALKVSERFCSEHADVIFRSSDDVLFKIHRKNLEVCTGGFAPPGIPTMDEIVPLTESESTLELLFQFIYPQRHPNLLNLPFDILDSLAEAVEKYEVYPAMNIATVRMQAAVYLHPIEVLNYAYKHGYPDVADMAVSSVAVLGLDVVADKMIPNLIPIWLRYYQNWLIVLARSHQWDPQDTEHARICPKKPCQDWESCRWKISMKLSGSVKSISIGNIWNLFNAVPPPDCGVVSHTAWKQYIEREIYMVATIRPGKLITARENDHKYTPFKESMCTR